MGPEDWSRVKTVFDAAVLVNKSERSSYLRDLCPNDFALQREVKELLESFDLSEDFMERPFAAEVTQLLSEIERDELEPGQIFNRYRIIRRIGVGGMGKVYLAQDTHLKRLVAIKLLSADATGDPDHLARFVQEARFASALNHPNIVTVYEIGQDADLHFISTEFVVGPTLRQQLSQAPFQVSRALDIAIQITSALVVAHEADIVHRDIKPENIMLREDGYLKVLDFGLAKLSRNQGPGAASASDKWRPIKTDPGFIMGTVNYMSPEQARGIEVDERTDIWSMGVVLYEMLTSKPPFEGLTSSDVMAAILKQEPKPITEVVPHIPGKLGHIVEKALSKTLDERYQKMTDMLLDLEDVRSDLDLQIKREPSAERSPERRSDRKRIARGTEATDAPVHPKLSQTTFTDAIEQYPTWSPTGEEVAFSREESGIRSIFAKNVTSGEERRLTSGNHDDIQPAWSPDGKTILFVRSRQPNVRLEPSDVFGRFDDGDILAMDLGTHKVSRLVENAFNPSYSPDGTRIAFDASWAGPRRIWAVSSSGHNPQQLTSDVSDGISHARPRWSPDGKKLVFQNIEPTKFDVRVFVLSSGKSIWITNDGVPDFNPVWSPSGAYIYFSSHRGGGINIWRTAVSPEGTPIRAPQQLTIGAGQDVEIAISRDGKRLAFSIVRQNAEIWRLSVSPDTGRPLGMPQEVITTTREDSRGAWSPDGKMIAFNSDRAGKMHIWLHSLTDGRSRQLTSGVGGDFQANWSPDGKQIAFFSSRAGNLDIWLADVGSGELKQLTSKCSADVNPSFSPDGTMIAYDSDKSGRPEVWVMKPDGSETRQVTDTGLGVTGHYILWDPDSDAVIARCPGGGGRPATVRIRLDSGEASPLPKIAGGHHMSFSPDRSRIIDVVRHRALWVSPLNGRGKPENVFEFSDPDVRIDYPAWSPDGRWVLFDRLRPRGGDVWVMEDFEHPAADDIANEDLGEIEVEPTEPRSIAILPFMNLTGDRNVSFYEFSLADAVITELARQRSLVVRPSSVVAKYIGHKIDPLEVGKQLNVDAILSTSFLSTKKRVRVNTQLIDVRKGNILWGESMDSHADDIISVQDAISVRIVEKLKLELRSSAHPAVNLPATTSSRAYEEYLLGRDQYRQYVFHTVAEENVEAAIAHFKCAIDLDSNFALAHCALGTSLIQRVLKGVGVGEDLDGAANAFDQALALDSDLYEARAYRALVLRFQGNAEASREQLSALRRDAPNNFEAQYMSAASYRLDGNYENAFRCYSEMMRLDPTAKVSVHCFRARFFWYQGKYEQAFRELDEGKRLAPNHPFVGYFHAIVTFLSGNPGEAAESLKSLLEVYPLEGFRPLLSMCRSALGDRESALNELTQRTESVAAANPDVSYGLASAYLMAGKTDLALHWLKYSIDHGYRNRPWLESSPTWTSMHHDPRFTRLTSGLARPTLMNRN
jgi:eukaryotic-like serine/threonine-protein kinase